MPCTPLHTFDIASYVKSSNIYIYIYVYISDDFRKLHKYDGGKFEIPDKELDTLYSEIYCYFSMYKVCISQYEGTKNKEFLSKASEFFSEIEIKHKKYSDAFYDYRSKLNLFNKYIPKNLLLKKYYSTYNYVYYKENRRN